MQGCGELQLTWYSFQDQAMRMGGLWRLRAQLRVGGKHAWTLVKRYGWVNGLAAYNGSGPAAREYGRETRQLVTKWHRRLS